MAEETEITEQTDISTLDDALLDKALNEDTSQSVETTETKPETEVKKEEVKPEEIKPEEKKEGIKPSEVITEEEKVEIPKSEYEKLNKRISDEQQFIQRQANEIGELRKTLRQQIEAKLKEIEDPNQLIADPAGFLEAREQIKDAEMQDRNLQRMEQSLHSKIIINQFIPDFEKRIDDITEVIKTDGLGQDIINNFRANPYADTPAVLFNLSKRAELLKESNALKAKVATLEEQLKKLQAEPHKVAKKIEQALQASKTITGATGGSKVSDETMPEISNISDLSDVELNKLIKERTKQEGIAYG